MKPFFTKAFLLLLYIKCNAQTTITYDWLTGADTVNQIGVYGTKGIASASNVPGARYNSVSWSDANGNLWLFGGTGTSTTTASGPLNDLWKYNTTNGMWTWVTGSNTLGVAGSYGTKGVPSSTTCPGARQNAYTWVDNTGNLWLFGGTGLSTGGPATYLNDLWKFNTSTNQWTWMSGASSGTPTSVYGTQGVASSSNTPGGRFGGASWIDNSNNLWLFGGQQVSNTQRTNDLWKYNISTGQWTWVSGANTINQNGNYGTLGISSNSNVPGARQASVYWKDNNNNFWLFGGDGIDATNTSNNYLNDLWKYNPSNNQWTWMSGSTTFSNAGVYGTKGVANPSNIPGARQMSVGWTDNSNNLWLFGAWGYVGPPFGRINDLWKYSITNNTWTWMGGQNVTNQPGIYGTQGVATTTNIPGARRMAISWTDSNGKFWLFGGSGIDKNNKTGSLNDLWKFDIGSTTEIINPEGTIVSYSYYPNPAKSILYISNNVTQEKIEVVLINEIGELCIKKDYESVKLITLDLTDIKPGFYILKINEKSYKVIKE